MNYRKSRRRRFTFTLRQSAVVSIFCFVILGFFSQRYRSLHKAQRDLSELGATVTMRKSCLDFMRQGASSNLLVDFLCIPRIDTVRFHGDWLPPLSLAQSPDFGYWFRLGQDVDDKKLAKLVATLVGLPYCPAISLIGTEITDDGLAHIGRLEELSDLDLTGSNISRAGLLHLRGLSLTSLDLSHTGISDESVVVLSGFVRLKYLDISFTKITPSGEEQLRSALPNCTVIRAESVSQREVRSRRVKIMA